MTEDNAYNQRFPAERLARAVIELNDGRRLESPTVQADGDPETPLSPETFRSKFHGLAAPALGEHGAEAVWNSAGELTDGGSLDPFLNLVLSAPENTSDRIRTTNSAA